MSFPTVSRRGKTIAMCDLLAAASGASNNTQDMHVFNLFTEIVGSAGPHLGDHMTILVLGLSKQASNYHNSLTNNVNITIINVCRKRFSSFNISLKAIL